MSRRRSVAEVSGVANYTRLDEVGGFNVGGQDVSIGSLDNYAVDLNVRQPLFRAALSAGIQAPGCFPISQTRMCARNSSDCFPNSAHLLSNSSGTATLRGKQGCRQVC